MELHHQAKNYRIVNDVDQNLAAVLFPTLWAGFSTSFPCFLRSRQSFSAGQPPYPFSFASATCKSRSARVRMIRVSGTHGLAAKALRKTGRKWSRHGKNQTKRSTKRRPRKVSQVTISTQNRTRHSYRERAISLCSSDKSGETKRGRVIGQLRTSDFICVVYLKIGISSAALLYLYVCVCFFPVVFRGQPKWSTSNWIFPQYHTAGPAAPVFSRLKACFHDEFHLFPPYSQTRCQTTMTDRIEAFLADRGYDADAIRQEITAGGFRKAPRERRAGQESLDL